MIRFLSFDIFGVLLTTYLFMYKQAISLLSLVIPMSFNCASLVTYRCSSVRQKAADQRSSDVAV